jgi:hypothetical protein
VLLHTEVMRKHDGGLQRRLLAYALLHRHSNLPKYLQNLPAPPAQTPGALAGRWWRLD